MPPTTRRRRDVPPPRTGAAEADVLLGFLDYLRDSVVRKVDGVAEPAVREPQVPSGTSLLGLLKHLGQVERATFLGERVDDWQATFRPGPEDSVASLTARYRDAIDAANEVIRTCDDLAAPIRYPGTRRGPSTRWALAHMIEETGRHAGHLDILRELVDGSTGR
jgi:hypothetical protein